MTQLVVVVSISRHGGSKSQVSIVGFNVPLDALQFISGQFYGSDDPTNSVIALKD